MKNSILANTVVLVQPDYFGYNQQTAKTNSFMNKVESISQNEITSQAMNEFKGVIKSLEMAEIDVCVLKSRRDIFTPDAVFPNNWFSTDSDGNIILYPMLTPNRRAERQPEKLINILMNSGFSVNATIDLSHHENRGNILEGTGSIVFSRDFKVAFAMGSPRTDEQLFKNYCRQFGYKPVFFHAYDSFSRPIYHTNVIMAIGDGFAVLCSESIKDRTEQAMVHKVIKDIGLERIDITLKQVEQFCGNIIQLQSGVGDNKIVLSKKALNGFHREQKRTLSKYGKLIPVQIDTIEEIGGGSARCMIAEVILPRN